jgi:hypothetical protein
VQPLPTLATALRQRSARLRSLAAEVQQARTRARCNCGPDVGQLVQCLYEAAEALASSSEALLVASRQSQSFVARTIGGSGGARVSTDGGVTGSSSSGGAKDAIWQHPDHKATRSSEPYWGEAEAAKVETATRFEDPTCWIGDVNGAGVGAPGRNNNCVDCARATEVRWRGNSGTAARHIDATAHGAPAQLLESWTGGTLHAATMASIASELTKQGPGSSAIVVSAWHGGGAHAYNAVNDRGEVKWIDGQSGRVDRWPPPYASQARSSWAIVMGPSGKPAAAAP